MATLYFIILTGTEGAARTHHGDVVPIEENLIQFRYPPSLRRDLAVQPQNTNNVRQNRSSA